MSDKELEEVKGLIGIDSETLGLIEVIDMLTVDVKDMNALQDLIFDCIWKDENIMNELGKRALKLDYYKERM